jgi:hypothetical protein
MTNARTCSLFHPFYHPVNLRDQSETKNLPHSNVHFFSKSVELYKPSLYISDVGRSGFRERLADDEDAERFMDLVMLSQQVIITLCLRSPTM